MSIYLAIGLAVWATFGFFVIHLAGNPIARAPWALLGAALVPAAVLWMMMQRLAPTDTMTPSTLVRAMILGGLGSALVGGAVDSIVAIWSPVENGSAGTLSLLTAGIVEEAAKAAFVIVFGWNVAKTVRNGLFLGGAVGAGFALYETLGYITNSAIGANGQLADQPALAMATTAMTRAFWMPLMHPMWAALLGAAIFGAAAARGRFRLTFGVVAAYLGVAALHGIWDGGSAVFAMVVPNLFIAVLLQIPLTILLATIELLVWRRVVRRHPAPAPAVETPTAPQAS